MTLDTAVEPDRITVRPVGGHIGADVTGVDLNDDLDDRTIAALWAAVLEHKVVFLRGQDIDHARHVAFARRFGDLTRRRPPHQGIAPDGFPEILTVDPKVEDERYGTDFEERYRRRWTNYHAGWHTDLTPAVNPPKAGILRATAATSHGGDTQWTNLAAAYAGLSPALRALADRLRTEHAFFAGCLMLQHDELDRQVLAKNNDHPLVAVHPMVRVHPETGERILFVNPASTMRIVGLTPSESDHLLALFFEEMTRCEYTVRLRWEPGTVAYWDNRSTAHLSGGDFAITGERRTLHRVTLLGDRPVGPDGYESELVAGEPFTALPVSTREATR